MTNTVSLHCTHSLTEMEGIYVVCQKYRTCLNIDNFEMLSDRKVCDMSKFCCIEKAHNLQCI